MRKFLESKCRIRPKGGAKFGFSKLQVALFFNFNLFFCARAHPPASSDVTGNTESIANALSMSRDVRKRLQSIKVEYVLGGAREIRKKI